MIKVITENDLEMLMNVRKLLSEYFDGVTDVEKSKQFLREQNVFGEYQDDEIHGYISVKVCNEDHKNFPNSLFISELFVLEEWRNRGIGSSLVKTILDSDLTKEYERIYVTYTQSNSELKDFYTKFGFTEYKKLESGNYALVRYSVNLNI